MFLESRTTPSKSNITNFIIGIILLTLLYFFKIFIEKEEISIGGERKLLIGGIDVGLHTSIALLDLDGKIISLDTLVNAENSYVIDHIMDFGNVLVLSTDKAKAPSRMKKIANSISAKILLPSKNLTKKKKRILVSKFLEEEIKMNDHEKAALASAIFAYKRFVPSFKKLQDKLQKNGKIYAYEKERRALFLRMLKRDEC